MLEIIVKDSGVEVAHFSICDKFKFGILQNLEAWSKDEENKQLLREEQGLTEGVKSQ